MALVMIFLFGITASTFAWFKINSNASVSGFEFTVQGGEGYQISLDDVNYSHSLTSKQMTQAILAGYDSSYTIYGDDVYYGAVIENGEIVSGTKIPEYTVSERVSRIAWAVASIRDFCSSVGFGQGKLLYTILTE